VGTGALDGLRVVEMGGQIAAAYCTKLLADLGAAVVKIEPPGGDPLRAWGPWPGDQVEVARGGGLFRYLNAGKHSRMLDLERADGIDAVIEHVARSDLIVESLGEGALERAGLSVDRLSDANARLALVRISDFGQRGPHVGIPTSQLVLQAMGGWVSGHGVLGTDPVQVGGRLAEYTVASFAACAALTAWRAACTRGEMVVADLSALECLIGTLPYPMLFNETLEALGLPQPEARHFPLPGIVRCRDGWVGINALTGQHWLDVGAMLGVDEFSDRQRDLSAGIGLDEFFSRIDPWLRQRDAQEIVEISQAFRIPAAPVGDGRMMLEYAQFKARPFFLPDAEDEFVTPGAPYRLSATPVGWRSDLEAHGGGSRDRETRERAALPFSGLRVVDLGTFWAGPYATMYLGAMGADVLKIESIRRPDGFRFSGAFPQTGADWYDRSGIWQATNLNKRDITLDLARDEGQTLLRRLLERADVVLENFSARVVEQFGLGYEQLRELKRDLIMVRMPGFGLEGPWRDYVGWAMVIEQATGMAAVTGSPDRPMSPGGFIDPVIGLHAAVAIQAALEHRARTGEGQLIEVAQLETGACLTAEQVIDWSMNRRARGREGNRHRVIAPQGVYRCRGEAWVALSVRDDDQWAALAEVMDAPALRDLSLTERHARHDELDERIGAWTRRLSADDVVAALRPLGLPVARVITTPAMYDEPQLVARGYYQALDNAKTGTRRYPGWPMRFSFAANHHRFGPPTLGQHNEEVLAGELGLEDAELERLRGAGVIGDHMPAR
jgi:crotonobetainyl-CoA:carnitine CoA-transferase CaiB-like acyl-CoA transferase